MSDRGAAVKLLLAVLGASLAAFLVAVWALLRGVAKAEWT